MQYYLAPMEGVTGFVYRRVHRRFFPGVDKYFMPFISPSQDHVFTKRDLRELSPEHNGGLTAVPQLLTRRADDFVWAAGALEQMGYREVNLNLGCPSGTVVAKGKGSGFLKRPAELDEFLSEIFSRVQIAISIKTRLGMWAPEEFGELLEIYNKYPAAELILHPRIQKDFYRHPARRAEFARYYKYSAAPVCYNGDLVTPGACGDCAAEFPTVERLMLGRGLIADPALIRRAKGGGAADRETLHAFHGALYEGYAEAFGSRRNAMLRMKEIWFYHIHLYQDAQRHAKAIRKAADTAAYETAVAAVFRELELREDAAPGWQ